MGALRAYILIMTVGILSKFNLLNQFNSLGFGISPNALSHVVLISLAFFSFRLAVIYSKFYYIANIFDVFFYKSDPPRRALLLAEYPLAFEVIKFYQGQIGTLPHTARMKLPYRMLGMLIFLVTGIIAYLGFSIYIYCSLASTVWNSSGGLPTFWSHALFVISTSLMICSWLLPFDLMIKKSYMHIGFIKMLNAAHELDLERYRRYFEWTRRIRKPDQRL